MRPEEEKHLAALKPYCAEIHAVPLRRSRIADVRAYALSVFFGRSFLVTRDAKPAMFDLVRRLVRAQPFDIIHADQLTMAQFGLEVRRWKLEVGNTPVPRTPVLPCAPAPQLVFDAHNAVWQIVERAQQTAPFFMRPFLALEARRIKQYEGALIQQFDHTLAVSAVDRQALLEAAASTNHVHHPISNLQSPTSNLQSPISNLQSRISIIPIAIDSTQFLRNHRITESPNMLTIGTLFYPPNADGVRWFLHQVCPFIRQRMPAATLTIIGSRPPADISQFAIRNPRFATVTGYVPDLTPYLDRAALMVIPVRAASGMRVRILEALARGIPVVTTATGVEGIDATHGEHLLIADEPEQFAAEVVRLLNDGALRQHLSTNGRRLMEEKYDWRVVLPKLERVYESLVTAR